MVDHVLDTDAGAIEYVAKVEAEYTGAVEYTAVVGDPVIVTVVVVVVGECRGNSPTPDWT